MPHPQILTCLLASLFLSTSISVSLESQAQSFQPTRARKSKLSQSSPSSQSIRPKPKQEKVADTRARFYHPGPTTIGAATRGVTITRVGGYCGQSIKPVTALIPPEGVSFTAQAGADLWVALPPKMADQAKQKFRLTVSPVNGTGKFTQNYWVTPTSEGLAQISIPPQAFSQSANGRTNNYDWQLTYFCSEASSALPMMLSGVIGVKPQAIAHTLTYRDRLDQFGKHGHWFDLLKALMSPPPGTQRITASELKSFLELDTVKLDPFYPELATLILQKETNNNDLRLQLQSLTNSSRTQEGLTPLNSSSELQKAAQDYANLMAKYNCPLIHHCGGTGLNDRLKGRNIPTTFRAENIAKIPKNGPEPGQAAFNELQKSWSHRRNSHIPEWTDTGVGVAETPENYYFVQIFNQSQGLPSFESRHELILPPKSPTPRLDFEQALLKHSAAEGISLIEGKGLRNFAQFLDTAFIKKSNSPSVSEIASMLSPSANQPQKKAGIIYVVATEKTLLLYLLVPQSNGQPTLIRKTVPVSRLKVLGTAQKFRQRIITPIHETDFLPYATQLHHWIIDPLQSSLDELDLDTLLFTLDDGLRSIPVAALHNGQTFLVERYSMALLPTFGLTETGDFQMDQQKILAMGITQAHRGLSALPSVKTEVEEITKLFDPRRSTLTLNENSTVEQLASLSQSQEYGIIHLATHAQFQPQKAGESFLQFWNRRLNLQGLGSLGRQLKWDTTPTVEMLVMSACTTAMGDRTAELGFAGSAVLAGVKSTVANLWHVNDISSTAFMIDFYRNLDQAPTKTEAFRQTQMAMLRGQLRITKGQIVFPNQTTVNVSGSPLKGLSLPLSHPYYWAGHTVIGNWN